MSTDNISIARWGDNETLRMALEAAGMGLWIWDAGSGSVNWDDQTCLIFGCEPGTGPTTYDEYLDRLHPEDRMVVHESINEAIRTGIYRDIEHRITRPDGSVRWILGKGAILHSPEGRLLKMIGGVIDITQQVEAKRAEAQKAEKLQQAHQMEIVGRLAGGLAHDFNNFLTVINGHAELILGELDVADPRRASLDIIRRAGESAAELTRQLLAYGRKQVLRPKVLDLNKILMTLRPLLARVAGENVKVQLDLKQGAAMIQTDPIQLEQLIINLVLNARDAMPVGGELTIGTDCVERETGFVGPYQDFSTGHYVLLTITDTGVGMDEETRVRIFEPFFTTKEFGTGTGLGMSIVQGIVEQSGGAIEVRSQPGEGTRFSIHLPEVDGSPTEGLVRSETVVAFGKGNVMVVEDHSEVRQFATAILKSLGYRVIEAESGAEALMLFERNERVDLLLTDVVMPGTSGPELAAHMERLRPGIKVLYMSGYTADKIAHIGTLDPKVDFIQKPFSSSHLGSKVREILERSCS
jgi:PAS domain S-box-containing protein